MAVKHGVSMPDLPLSPLDEAAPEPSPEAGRPPAGPPEATPAPPCPRWHPLARAVAYLVAVQIISFAVVAPLAFFASTLGDRFFRGLGASWEIGLLGFLFAWPPAIGVTVLFLRLLDRRDLTSIGARWPAGGWRMAVVQFALASLAVLALAGAWTVLVLALPDQTADLRFGGFSGDLAPGPAWWPLPSGLLFALLLIGFLVQSGLEEWMVRGYIYRTLKDRWPPWVAALVSSLLFALMHAVNPAVSALALLNVLLAGVILAALVERSGSLWSATAAHGIWNFTIGCLLSLPVSGIRIFRLLDAGVTGDERLTGGGFGPEGSLVLTLLALLLALLLWWPLRHRPAAGTPYDRHPGDGAPSASEDTSFSTPL
jgi:membrane protease YdiL (CAAX protease family)